MEGLYVILDKVAQEFSSPQLLKNDGVALRMYRAEMEKVSEYAKADYALYKIGMYDTKSAELKPFRKPEEVCMIIMEEKE